MELTGERTNQAKRIPGHFVDSKGPAEGVYVFCCGGSYVSTDTAPDPPIGAEVHYVHGLRVGSSRAGFRVLREIPDQK